MASPSAGAPELKYGDVNTVTPSPGEVKGLILNLRFISILIHNIKKVKNCFPKYLLFIDLKNAYDKVDHKRFFNKLNIRVLN